MLSVHALSGGFLELDRRSMIPDGPETRWTVPVLCVLVTHPRGRLLFDTGMHCQTMTDAPARLGARAKFFGVHTKPGEDVVSQLGQLGVAPGEVDVVANSHFHFDHCGGNEYFQASRFLVQKRELDAARATLTTPSPVYRPNAKDFDHPLRYEAIDGEHDVFGDGSAVLIPSYGHTPGHQSLVLRSGRDRFVFTADAVYTKENLDRDILPGVVWDGAEMKAAFASLRALRDRQGAAMFYGHEPAQWPDRAAFPTALA
jgi:glyoxylase-like metal-dependent hydrolase (beta-lactamase superfamily II)